MALLTVANLTYSLGDRILLDGVNLNLDAGEHVGMVGRNGCGKSTLLKMIAGIGTQKADTGQIQVARGTSVGYLTQDPVLDPELTLRQEAGMAFAHLDAMHKELDEIAHLMATAEGDALDKLLKRYEQIEHKVEAAGGYSVDHQIDATLHGVGLTDEFFNVPVKSLSGGQKGRLSLAKLLLTHPDILLLDEPTNHLDIAGCQWLEGFLASYTGAVALVSHDRWLLDRVVSKIYEMDRGRLEEYPGNYQKYRVLRAERRAFQKREFEKQQDRFKSEQAFIDRYRAGQRATQAKGREKRLERAREDEALERPAESGNVAIRIRPVQRCGDLVVTTDAISKGYEQKPLFKNLSLVIKRGDRVGIIGPNGAGKSTLVGAMLGTVKSDSGIVKVGPSVNVGYYRQSHEHVDLRQSVVDFLRKFVPSETEQEARDLAGAFLFQGSDEQDKPMSGLSGGERSRAVLASLIVGGHNLLVFDEPTNHLDIASAEKLEEALRAFTKPLEGFGDNQTGGGTLILITHDRMLLEDLVDQLIILDGHGNVRHFLGTYSKFVEATAAADAAAAGIVQKKIDKDAKVGITIQQSSQQNKNKKNNAPGKGGGQQINAALSKLSQQALEEQIMELEGALSSLDAQLAKKDTYKDGALVKELQTARDKKKAELGPLEQEWARRTA